MSMFVGMYWTNGTEWKLYGLKLCSRCRRCRCRHLRCCCSWWIDDNHKDVCVLLGANALITSSNAFPLISLSFSLIIWMCFQLYLLKMIRYNRSRGLFSAIAYLQHIHTYTPTRLFYAHHRCCCFCCDLNGFFFFFFLQRNHIDCFRSMNIRSLIQKALWRYYSRHALQLKCTCQKSISIHWVILLFFSFTRHRCRLFLTIFAFSHELQCKLRYKHIVRHGDNNQHFSILSYFLRRCCCRRRCFKGKQIISDKIKRNNLLLSSEQTKMCWHFSMANTLTFPIFVWEHVHYVSLFWWCSPHFGKNITHPIHWKYLKKNCTKYLKHFGWAHSIEDDLNMARLSLSSLLQSVP